jgi:hypothetical protein
MADAINTRVGALDEIPNKKTLSTKQKQGL